jgi:hypothetical protein
MRYNQYKQMQKEAGLGSIVSGFTESIANVGPAVTDAASTGAAYLLAIAATIGLGAGYTAAKVTAKGKLDEDTVKKEYENSRLNADITKLRNDINSEYEAFKNKKAPTAARVIA